MGRLVENSLALTRDPGLGLSFGRSIRIPSLGIVGYAAMTQATLGDAIDVAIKYQALLARRVELRSRVEPGPGGGTAVISILPRVTSSRHAIFLAETVTACLTAAGGFLLGRPAPGLSLRFAYRAPEHHERYPAMFGCPVEFGCGVTELRFDAAALSAPLLYAAETSASIAEEQCAAALRPRLVKEGLVDRVRALLSANGVQFPSVRALARQLQTSERSLRRALSRQGTSYQALLDEIRLSAAMQYLDTTSLPVEDIARQVGFGSGRSFRRAFRRWTGKSPSELRAERAAQPETPAQVAAYV